MRLNKNAYSTVNSRQQDDFCRMDARSNVQIGIKMNSNTKIIYNGGHKAVINAVNILRRDMDAAFHPSDADGGAIRLIESDGSHHAA